MNYSRRLFHHFFFFYIASTIYVIAGWQQSIALTYSMSLPIDWRLPVNNILWSLCIRFSYTIFFFYFPIFSLMLFPRISCLFVSFIFLSYKENDWQQSLLLPGFSLYTLSSTQLWNSNCFTYLATIASPLYFHSFLFYFSILFLPSLRLVTHWAQLLLLFLLLSLDQWPGYIQVFAVLLKV